MAQRQKGRGNQGQRQGGPRPANGAGAPTVSGTTGGVGGRARANGNGATAATFTAETAREERSRAMGRRARQRLEQERAAKRRRLSIILGAITAVIVVGIAVAAFALSRNNSAAALTDPSAQNASARELALGSKAPDFTSSTVDGKQYTLAAQRGHPVLIEDFAIWCPHCQAETAALKRLNTAYAAKGLRILSVLASPYGKDYETSGQTDLRLADRGDIDYFKSTYSTTYPALVDHDFATANKYPLVKGADGQAGFPSIYILDPNGIVRYKSSGEATYDTLAKAVDAAIKGQSTMPTSSSKVSHR